MARLGAYGEVVATAVAKIEADRIIDRIWALDHTVWKPDPAEITNRLGWLTIAGRMQPRIPEMQALATAVRGEGYTDVLLLGMGGSSLAPEVFRKTFGVGPGGLDLAVLDSTDPGSVLALRRELNLATTLFVVSTKSGGTVETLSFFKYFYDQVAAELGAEQAGQHFVAITDPGSSLEKLAKDYAFRQTFLNDPNIGGRYSALSFFGLLPATLVGVDVATLLDRAIAEAENASAPGSGNRSVVLGATLGELARVGRDKVTFITSPELASFGDWVEQLIAESTGKDGQGILPVVGERLGTPELYGSDRLFVYLRLAGDTLQDAAVDALVEAGQPVVDIQLADLYDLGRQFFLWEMATAVAGHVIDIQPFDQPNVESAKVQARKMVAAYQETGELPQDEVQTATAANLDAFLARAEPGNYVSLQAYIQPTQASDAALDLLRTAIRRETGLAVTVGYGPRFLHSTGQLHKGDGGNGLFVQFTAVMPEDVPIPDKAGQPGSSISFGVLKTAQALGDGAALREAGRPLVHFHLSADPAADLLRIAGG